MRYAIVSIIVVALLVLVRAPAFADSLAILIDAHGSLTNGGLTYPNFSASLNFNNPDGTFSVRPSLQSIQITSDSNLFANTLQIRQVQWSGTIDLSIFNASKPELLLAVAYDVSGQVNHVAASQKGASSSRHNNHQRRSFCDRNSSIRKFVAIPQ